MENKEKAQERYLQLINERKGIYQSLQNIETAIDDEFINYITAEYPDKITKLENYLIKEGKIQTNSKINYISQLERYGNSADYGDFLIIKTNNNERIEVLTYASDYFFDDYDLKNKDINNLELEGNGNPDDEEISIIIDDIKYKCAVENKDYI
ncbi:MAG: hypothetical protein ACYDDE_00650 [bacterium]